MCNCQTKCTDCKCSTKQKLIERLRFLSKTIDDVLTDVCESHFYDDGKIEALWDLEEESYLMDNLIEKSVRSLQGS